MLTRKEISQYLTELNDRLADKGITGEIVLCGGAVMSFIFDVRDSTKDIDALFEPSPDIRDIVKSMAYDHNLEEDWLNDAAKGFIDTSRMGFVDVISFSNLQVRRLGDEEMLALKLAAAREDSKDTDDALFLMKIVGVESLEQVYEIIERYIPKPMRTPMVSFFAQEIYIRYKESR